MSQQRLPGPATDPIQRISNANFDELYAASTIPLGAGTPFRVTAQLTSAAAGTPVVLVPEASVGATQKVYVASAVLNVGGATAWTDATATKVVLQDTAASPVAGATWLKALLTGNAVLGLDKASTPGAALANGFTLDKGLAIAGDANFGAGSTITITVTGFIG